MFKNNRIANQQSLYCSGQNSSVIAAVEYLEIKRSYTSAISILPHIVDRG
jgi:hypothetical protein